MKIGILGSGSVAQTLGVGFMKHGHTVTLGTRDPAKLNAWKEKHPGALVATFDETARFGEVLVLAVKGNAALDALKLAGIDNLAGKTVLDTTNPIADAAPVHGVLQFFTGPNDSLMERLQKAAPDAKFVKAFNSVGGNVMVDPQLSYTPTMFICGNDDGAKVTATTILTQFGWETADMGKAEAARPIEALCQLWCIPGLSRGDWHGYAFKIVK